MLIAALVAFAAPFLFSAPVLALPEITLVELVHKAYATQATVALLIFVGACAVVGLLLAIISGRMAVVRWRVGQDAEAGA